MAPHVYTPTSVCRVLIGLAVLGGLIGLPALGRCADDGDFARATLRGLQGVYILIEDMKQESERAGLTTQQLQTMSRSNSGTPAFSSSPKTKPFACQTHLICMSTCTCYRTRLP
jgi:hypothetical protein